MESSGPRGHRGTLRSSPSFHVHLTTAAIVGNNFNMQFLITENEGLVSAGLIGGS